jgi:AraC-like DNA-binding protein
MYMQEHQPETCLFLWNGQGLYLGPGRDSSVHQHHAIQIGISFEQPIQLRYSPCDSYTAVPCFLMQPNTPHQVLTASRRSLFLWVEAESELARALLVEYAPTRFLSTGRIARIQQTLPALERLVLAATTCEQAEQIVAHILAAFLPDATPSFPLDERLSSLLHALKQQTYELSSFSPQQIAALLQLSESRLRHIFKQHFGLPMQRYLLWQRLLVAIEGITCGISLTQAAHEAGFADAAHLARTFRATFGITPSSILKNSHDVQVISCQP